MGQPEVEPMRHVHFIGIGGTGMGSLAGLLSARGIRVTGSDHALYPPMSTALENWGIGVDEGFRAENVRDRSPDLVVIGNVVRSDNPEAREAIDSGLKYRSFSDALYELAMADRHSIVVSGTHGKTTTTNLCAYLLKAMGRDPSFLVGGISLDFGGSFREGSGDHFVVEGDEYDTAFFDKTPKFLHYHPNTLIVTSVEFDHADIYRDLDAVKSAFRTLISRMPPSGVIIAAGGHEGVRSVIEDAPCRVIRYGLESQSYADSFDFTAKEISASEDGMDFRLAMRSEPSIQVKLPLFGRFNVENTLGALAAVSSVGLSLTETAPLLSGFQGVKRRQEIRGEERGVVVIDDFAHHPTAVAGSIEALKGRFPGRRLFAVFEPRTNTSRRRVFQKDYVQALKAADHVVVQRVAEAPIYSATGEVTDLFSVDELVADLKKANVEASGYDGVDEIVIALEAQLRAGDVVLVMSNGAFENIWEKLLRELAQKS
ncbi:MAG: UDP-N-acetylmuramate--L-alanine ligase [Deltaproteobacteria bacterium]|nr:UDP-N-acetylmuramate--L-alanine ligase [Deltaproteobacteria bacterium]